jgi:hypothetical protein
MKYKNLIPFILIALMLTIATSFLQRIGPVEGVMGNLCGDPGLCYLPAANSGLPLPYLIDNMSVSPVNSVSLFSMVDYFRPTSFLLDLLFFTLLFLALSPKHRENISTYLNKIFSNSNIPQIIGVILLAGFILALFSFAYQHYGPTQQILQTGEYGYRFRCAQETCTEDVLSGGFPFPYAYEDITQSPKKHLDPLMEDHFSPWSFLLDVIFYGLVCGVGFFYTTRKK